MDNRFLVYLDILGFSEAISDVGKHDQIHAIITELVEKNRQEEYQHEHLAAYGDAGHRHYIKPEITSFSDHVVLSVGWEKEFVTPYLLLYPIFIFVSEFNYLCLQHGFLTRGALSYGPLIHKDKMIYGLPLVEASKAEENEAIYPRIIITKTALKKLAEDPNVSELFESIFLIDFDGRRYFHWMRYLPMYLQMDGFKIQLLPFFAQTKKLIESNLAIYEEKLHLFSKWYWFAKYYNLSLKWIKYIQSERATAIEFVQINPQQTAEE
jgi:hypothetical protein